MGAGDAEERRALKRRALKRRALKRRALKRRRHGAASLDYVLVMGVVLPLVVFVYWVAPRMMNLVYELTSVVMGWPFQ